MNQKFDLYFGFTKRATPYRLTGLNTRPHVSAGIEPSKQDCDFSSFNGLSPYVCEVS
jgi:hypothetical protein